MASRLLKILAPPQSVSLDTATAGEYLLGAVLLYTRNRKIAVVEMDAALAITAVSDKFATRMMVRKAS